MITGHETEEDTRSEIIGIMADSHGRPETIAAAVSALRDRGCSVLYHLGDICDSASDGTTTACVDIIEQHQILAVKGNNEHTVSVNSLDREDGRIPGPTALFLGRLPLVRRLPGALFCHSLPFEKELGLSAMVRVLDRPAALYFRDHYPGHVLFRGHNHQPEVTRFVNGAIVSEAIPVNRLLPLTAWRPCAVTCGALTDSLCLIWHRSEDWICSLSCPA